MRQEPSKKTSVRVVLLTGLCFLVSIAAVSPAESTPKERLDLFRRARESIARTDFLEGRWPERSAPCQAALSQCLALVQELKGHIPIQELLLTAYTIVDRAYGVEEQDPSEETVLTVRRVAYEAAAISGDLTLRKRTFQKYLSAVTASLPVPKAAAIMLEEGIRSEKEGRRKEAEDLFRRIINMAPREDPSCRRAYGELALILSKQGKTGEILMGYYRLKKEGKLGEIPFEGKLWLAGEIQNEGLEHILLLKMAQKERPEKAELCQYLIVNYLHTSRYKDELKRELQVLKEKYPNSYKGFGEKVEASLASDGGHPSEEKRNKRGAQ